MACCVPSTTEGLAHTGSPPESADWPSEWSPCAHLLYLPKSSSTTWICCFSRHCSISNGPRRRSTTAVFGHKWSTRKGVGRSERTARQLGREKWASSHWEMGSSGVVNWTAVCVSGFELDFWFALRIFFTFWKEWYCGNSEWAWRRNPPQRVIPKSTRSYFGRPGLLFLNGWHFTPALNQDQPLQVFWFILSFSEA